MSWGTSWLGNFRIFSSEEITLSEHKILLIIQLEDNDQPLSLEVSPNLTEWGLKTKLEQKLNLENFTILVIDNQGDWIIADEECSQNNKGQTLQKLGISEKTTLSIKKDKEESVGTDALEGGKSMKFPNFQETIPVMYNPQAPEWQKPQKGFNFVGECDNCHQTVYIAKKIFDRIIHVEMAISDCYCQNPSCTNRKFKPEKMSNFIFYDCDFSIKGKIKGNTQDTTKVGQASINQAVSFSKGSRNNPEGNMVEWTKLHVKVVERKTSNEREIPNTAKTVFITIAAFVLVGASICIYKKYVEKQTI